MPSDPRQPQGDDQSNSDRHAADQQARPAARRRQHRQHEDRHEHLHALAGDPLPDDRADPSAGVAGGAAVTDDKYKGLVAGFVVDQASETRWGGAVGTGVEVGFAPNWSVGVEYDHLFMGNRNLTFTTPGAAAFTRTDNIKQDVDMGTVRVNYRWGGPTIAKY